MSGQQQAQVAEFNSFKNNIDAWKSRKDQVEGATETTLKQLAHFESKVTESMAAQEVAINNLKGESSRMLVRIEQLETDSKDMQYSVKVFEHLFSGFIEPMFEWCKQQGMPAPQVGPMEEEPAAKRPKNGSSSAD